MVARKTPETIGTITFTTLTALTLWTRELLGQLSDGYWENASPSDHWTFWHDLEPSVGEKNEVKTATPWHCHRTRYNFTAKELLDVVGARMIAECKMALACAELGYPPHERWLAEYMPPTREEWSTSVWPEYLRERMSRLDKNLMLAFYRQTYTVKDLRTDLARVKEAVRSVKF